MVSTRSPDARPNDIPAPSDEPPNHPPGIDPVTETRIWCDGCRDRITSDRTALRVRCGPPRRRLTEGDLSPTCLERFQALLAPATPAPLEATPPVGVAHRKPGAVNGATAPASR